MVTPDAPACREAPDFNMAPTITFYLYFLLVPPFFGFMLMVWTVGLGEGLFALTFGSRSIAVIWSALTLGSALWSLDYNRRRHYISLRGDSLVLGRGSVAIHIAADEIQSIVVGLPCEYPGGGRNPQLAATRQLALLIRLSGGRLLPLRAYDLGSRGGPELLEAIKSAHADKIASRYEYTKEEIKRLTWPKYNAIMTIRGQ